MKEFVIKNKVYKYELTKAYFSPVNGFRRCVLVEVDGKGSIALADKVPETEEEAERINKGVFWE